MVVLVLVLVVCWFTWLSSVVCVLFCLFCLLGLRTFLFVWMGVGVAAVVDFGVVGDSVGVGGLLTYLTCFRCVWFFPLFLAPPTHTRTHTLNPHQRPLNLLPS